MVDNCRIVEEDSQGIIMEIDLFEHRKLLKHLTNWEMENLKRKLVMVILLEMYFQQSKFTMDFKKKSSKIKALSN